MWLFKLIVNLFARKPVNPSVRIGPLDKWTPPAESGHDLVKRKSVLLLESLKPGQQAVIEHSDVNCVGGGSTCTLTNAVHRLERQRGWHCEHYHPDHQEHVMHVRVLTDEEYAEKKKTTGK